MNKAVQIGTALAAGLACSLTGTSASAQTTIIIPTAASVKKPLELTRVSNLQLGAILITASGPSSATVRLSQSGVLTCPMTHFTCTGATSPAVYNASGNKQQRVLISTPATLILRNGSGNQIAMTVDAPASVTLQNSGNPGTNFSVGGSLTLSSATAEGLYEGTFSITAQYE